MLKNCVVGIRNIRRIEENSIRLLNLRSKFIAWYQIIQRTADIRIRHDFVLEKT